MSKLAATVNSLQPYPAYKSSGVEWLQEVPAHWGARRLKSILSLNDSGVWGSDFADDGIIVLRSTEQTVSGDWHIVAPAKRRLSPSEYANGRLKVGDLVVTTSSGSARHIGKTSIVTREVEALDCCFSNFMQRLRIGRDALPKFFWYVLNSQVSRIQLDYLSSTTTGLANLSGGIIGRIVLAFPPQSEQAAIARYLDHVDRHIRRCIQAKEKLVELLEEQRQAVINEAVTGRVNVRTGQPYPAYKPSGVEWLGEVPAHWSLVRNRAILRRKHVVVGTRHSEYRLLSLTKGGVVVRDVSTGRGKFSADMGTSQEVKCGDLIFCLFDVPETPRTVGLSQHDGMITGAYSVFECRDPVLARFLETFYIALDDRKALSPLYSGLRNTIPPPRFLAIKTPIPPKEEQIAITRFLDHADERIRRGIQSAQRQIDLLKEYRTRLVADVVTGKLDVREAAAELAGDLEEPESITGSDASAVMSGESSRSPNIAT